MATSSGWLQPLSERKASWLELFFDLVFVVAVAQLSHTLVEHPTADGFLGFAALFVPVWWAWVGYTFYADRFETDDVAYRLLMLVGMLAVGALAVNVPDALGGGGAEFALSYVAVRAVLVALYVRAWHAAPAARPLVNLYATAFSLAAAVWLLSAFVPEPGRYWLWALALAIDVGAPLAFGPRVIPRAPIHASHIPERFGLFTIIVFGEIVLAVVLGTAETSWERRSVIAAVGGFAAAASLWWLYFDYLDTSVLRRSVRAGQVYVYGHLPLLLGLTAVGAGTALAISDAARGPLGEGARWALAGGAALCLFSMSVIHLATTHSVRDRHLWLRTSAAAAALVLAVVDASAAVFVPLVAVLLVALTAVEIAGQNRRASPP